MGAFLDKPKTEKYTAVGEANGIRYGVSAMQGWRMEMEDAHACVTSLPFDPKACFFGVFDGHAGSKVAQHCSGKLLDSISSCYKGKGKDDLKSAIEKGFIKLDKEMKAQPPWDDGKDRSGTTAVIALITPDLIYLGNCGDSRGILQRGELNELGQGEYATADHKPYNEKEKMRIEKAGGTVMMQRVNGSLAVSRALGDFDYKQASNLSLIEQLVSPEPDVTVLKRDTENDKFLLLACDGIFDVMTNEEVIVYVMHQLQLKEDLSEICSSLIDKCLYKVGDALLTNLYQYSLCQYRLNWGDRLSVGAQYQNYVMQI
jgi:serine/threonine protein phosphatase PrpC